MREFMARQREEQIDAQLAAAYGALPQGAEEDAYAEASRKGFVAANVDW